MTGILCNTADTLLFAPGDLHELVRGQEHDLVERLTPLVRRQNVTLDLAHVERIDAAGIAALISLYGSAQTAGNDFNVVNASHRVAEILTLVGLDRILLSQNAVQNPQTERCLARPAA
jgi:anti-anti-sigma factor